MIKGRYIRTIDEIEEVKFKITFDGDNEVICEDDNVKNYLENIDTTLYLSPLEPDRDITFETATEREMVLFLLSKAEFKVDEYPDDITLPLDEDDTEEGILI